MPLFEFEYYNEEGDRILFEDLYPAGSDLSNIMSPCGKFLAKVVPSMINSSQGLTLREKIAGTTKKRVESSRFMRNQRDRRKKIYHPDSYQGSSNEIWTGVEGKDGVIESAISKKVENKSTSN